jgi:hypothetical protein
MTNEEKQLVLKDLCTRLPYGVIVKENDGVKENDNKLFKIDMFDGCIKPYLRPMSSMTEEEINEYENFITNEKDDQLRFCNELVFYNSHHFDYRGLIEKGLAIEAPEGMYKTE